MKTILIIGGIYVKTFNKVILTAVGVIIAFLFQTQTETMFYVFE